MTKTPSKRSAASRPVEVVGRTIEHALDPLASALKRATQKRVEPGDTPAPAAAWPATVFDEVTKG